MDPQHRLFLEVRGKPSIMPGSLQRLAGSETGVFIASYFNDYANLQYSDPESIDGRTLTGTLHSVLANRLSYLLDLRGPSVAVDTACSSSLVAVHLACAEPARRRMRRRAGRRRQPDAVAGHG